MGMIVMSLQDYYLLVLNPPPSRGRQEEDREKEGRGQGKGRESAGGRKWKAGESKSFCSGRVTNQMLHWSHVFSSCLTYNCRKKFIQSLMQRFSELTWTIVFVVHWTFFFTFVVRVSSWFFFWKEHMQMSKILDPIPLLCSFTSGFFAYRVHRPGLYLPWQGCSQTLWFLKQDTLERDTYSSDTLDCHSHSYCQPRHLDVTTLGNYGVLDCACVCYWFIFMF